MVLGQYETERSRSLKLAVVVEQTKRTVTNDIANAVREIKAGRIEFKSDKFGVVSNAVGKLSFPKEKLVENIKAFISAIAKAKPSSTKGHYMVSLAISSTMGPGLKVDMSGLVEA